MEEVWFGGAHGDIGGGWPRKPHETRTLSTITLKWMIQEMINLPGTPQKVKFGKEKEWAPTVDVKDLAQDNSRPEYDLDRYVLVTDKDPPVFPKPHDNLIIGRAHGGVSDAVRTIAWRCMGESSLPSRKFDVCAHIGNGEYIPIFTRLVYNLETAQWVPKTFPANKAELRQIPKNARIHPSVKLLHKAKVLEDWEVASVRHLYDSQVPAPVSGR